MKLETPTVLLIGIVLILILGGGMSIPKANLGEIGDYFSGWFGGGEADDGTVSVNKPLQITLMNKFAGENISSKTIDIYDSDGQTKIQSVACSATGTGNTGAISYESGKIVYFRYESSNDKQWFKREIPKQNEKDAESQTYNNIALWSFAIGTYTSDRFAHGAYSLADAGEYNFTGNGTLMSFTYSLSNTGNDNTGLIESYDPIYAMKWQPVIYVTFSGTEYEKILVYDFSYDYTLGTTHYVAEVGDAYGLTKHKVGNEYLSNGDWSHTFSLDGSGYTAGASSVTMQIYVYMYSDPTYAENHGGAYGPESVQIAEHTITLKA